MNPIHTSRRFGLAVSSFFVILTGPEISAQKSQDEFFGLDKSWDIRLEIAPEVLEKMYPTGRMSIGLSQRGRYSYGKANIRIGSRSFPNVGIRFKGNSTFWGTSGSMKKSFKIDFDRFVEGGEFIGLKKINLQNNATDATQIREAVAYKVYRDAGVPGSRTCFARVYLTVKGRFDDEYLGNYTVVEQVDRRYLARHYDGDKAGLILKPEGKIMPYLGDDWNEDYDAIYIPKTEVEEVHAKPLIRLAKLLASEDDEALLRDIEKVLDVDEFLNYSAVTAFLANLDSPFMLAHNYFMAVPDGSKLVVWIPWDLNLSVGGFSMAGSDQANLSVFEPTRLPLFTRLIADPRWRKVYEKHLWALAKGPGSAETMGATLALARKTTGPAIAEEANRGEDVLSGGKDKSRMGGMFGGRGGSRMFRGASIDQFVERRAKAVISQLEGKSQGRPVGNSMLGGFGRGRARGPRAPGEMMRDLLDRGKVFEASANLMIDRDALSAGVQKLFAILDADHSGSIARRELAKTMRSQRGENTTPAEARALLRHLDADRDRRVTAEELAKAVSERFGEWDRDSDGKLSRNELSAAKR